MPKQGTSGALLPTTDVLSVHVSDLCNSADSRFRTVCDSSPRAFRAPERPLAYAVATVRGEGTQSRRKDATLLPTWIKGLDRLYSLSIFTGSLQILQRPYLYGVPHNNTTRGRSCGHGRNSQFSAEILPMRLARGMPRDWQSANESRALLSTASRRPWGRGAGSCKSRPVPMVNLPHAKLTHESK
jgi:hypothetical protein